MSQPDYDASVGDTNVPHESDHAAATDDHMVRTSLQPAIPDVTVTAIADAASPGAAYVQAEAVAVRTELVALNARVVELTAATNKLLLVLRDAELIPLV